MDDLPMTNQEFKDTIAILLGGAIEELFSRQYHRRGLSSSMPESRQPYLRLHLSTRNDEVLVWNTTTKHTLQRIPIPSGSPSSSCTPKMDLYIYLYALYKAIISDRQSQSLFIRSVFVDDKLLSAASARHLYIDELSGSLILQPVSPPML
ncbi:hypothetical protein BO78DRAFT_218276 [Aspergillus sclerotiicarbonarius CBS 121057]|uniref:Uncharacterized protein n=1 Tax=Aspergillus sclerotiicarbonarius (strain CBS 121057 / IBT 28362) TaxID=1448318 RepID=A0A319ERH9_ASPSB|nr:hypothetical protein BO78DRAFT_218276 [Aspergillus sclerotiicarbonarius CBS 121057]